MCCLVCKGRNSGVNSPFANQSCYPENLCLDRKVMCMCAVLICKVEHNVGFSVVLELYVCLLM